MCPGAKLDAYLSGRPPGEAQLDRGCEESPAGVSSATFQPQVEREVEEKAQVDDSDLAWSPGPAPLSSGYVTSGELSSPL